MSILHFHQVQLAGLHPEAAKLNVLQNTEALRAALREPGERPFFGWPVWPFFG
jgi:hypothetical protein